MEVLEHQLGQLVVGKLALQLLQRFRRLGYGTLQVVGVLGERHPIAADRKVVPSPWFVGIDFGGALVVGFGLGESPLAESNLAEHEVGVHVVDLQPIDEFAELAAPPQARWRARRRVDLAYRVGSASGGAVSCGVPLVVGSRRGPFGPGGRCGGIDTQRRVEHPEKRACNRFVSPRRCAPFTCG